jgi:hypothetical protein
MSFSSTPGSSAEIWTSVSDSDTSMFGSNPPGQLTRSNGVRSKPSKKRSKT